MTRRRTLRELGFVLLVGLLSAGIYWVLSAYVFSSPESLSFQYEGQRYELLMPYALGIVVLAPALLLAVRYSLADLPWQQAVASVLLRTIFLALLALSLSRLVTTTESQKIATVILLDVSDSVTDEAVETARRHVLEVVSAKQDDSAIRLITFAERPRLERLTQEDGSLQVPPAAKLRHVQLNQAVQAVTTPDGTESGVPSGAASNSGQSATPVVLNAGAVNPNDILGNRPGAGSNLQAALQLAYGVFPPGYLKRVLILSDGVETEGDVLAEAHRASQFGVKLYSRPYRSSPPSEVALVDLKVPDKVEIGEAFQVSAQVYASRATKARARLYQGEMLNGLDGVRELELQAGNNDVSFRSVVRFGGEVTYTLKLDEITEDRFTENNELSARLDVPGRPTVLYIEGQPARASYLTSALNAQQFDVDVRPVTAFPGSLAEMERYDLFILSDVPAEKVSLSSQDLVERYVRDLGGGFVFAGGEAGFGLGGWAHTTIERILPVRMDVERRKDMPSVAISLVIDRSGSMSGLPMEMAKAACRATVGTLQGDDLVEVIAFDSVPKRFVKIQPARYRSRIQNEIMRIQSGGGTAIFPALDMAYQDISVARARKKHVILLTDGRADTQGIRDLVQAMLAESITVTTVGLGDAADSDLLRMIAETGGGRYHHVPDPNSLPRIFTRETELIARQAAVQEWFPVTQTASADFLRGIAVNTAPLLHGYVATQAKGPPAQTILVSDKGEPILARWRVGLGQTLAWTSDVKNNWAVDWLRWSGFSRFWGQLVREHMRKKHRREIDMRTRVAGDRVQAVVDAFTIDDRFDNGISAKLFVQGVTTSSEREVSMVQTAPGRYEADFRLDGYGAFTLKAEHFKEQDDGSLSKVGVSFGNVSFPYPREYSSFEPDFDLLERTALAGGGAVDPKPAAIFDPGEEKLEHHKQLWPNFLYAALVVFLLDLLLRRVRLFDRKFVAKAGT